MADRPTDDMLPIDRLRNLVDRACRHLTPGEGTALRGALAGTMRNATAAIEELHQRAADAEDDRDRARRWAVHLENELARAEQRISEYRDSRARWMKAANADRHTAIAAHDRLDAVRAECDAIDAEMSTEPDTQRAAMQHETVTRFRAALDAAGQPDCADPAHAGYATDGTCVHGPTTR